MKELNQFIFETPKKQTNKNYQQQSTNITHQQPSTQLSHQRKRRRIFEKQKKDDYLERSIFNLFHGSFEQQQISAYQVYQSDFCECSNPQQICQVLKEGFLQQISITQLQKQYDNILMNASRMPWPRNNIRKENLFRTLSKNYPEIFLSQINNIISVLQSNLTPAQFECLCWIQYHAHFEYLTYFLFKDIKKSFNNFERFKAKLNNQLLQENLYSIDRQYKKRGFGSLFQKFLVNYYDSVGAQIVPMTAYAHFIKIIYEKGHIVLCKLLKIFLTNEKEEFDKALVFLSQGDILGYRAFVREFYWEQILTHLENNALQISEP